MPTIYTAGNKGDKVRSDCFLSLQITKSGGRDISLDSKVKSLYGSHIYELLNDVLDHYNLDHVKLEAEDTGALDFVIAARTEAVIRKALKRVDGYLLPLAEYNDYSSSKERNRFSRLYLPGNIPGMMINAGIHHPDGIILDLEDSVAPDKKDESRILVRNALCSLNFYGAERMVRINQVPAGLIDIREVVPFNVHLILVPKCEHPEQINMVNEEIRKVLEKNMLKREVFLMPIVESALGVENAFAIASAPNVVALAIGLEDYTADLGVRRTQDANESFYARTRIVNASKAAGIQAIDSVFSDVGDEEGLRKTIKISKSLGFEGMGCIHPRQIKVIHESFAPEPEEIEKAQKIVNAFILAGEKGLGVVSLGSKMIDPPVVKRAQKIIDMALELGLTEKNWRDKYVKE